MASTSEILNRAADLIEEQGWWNGRATSSSGICALLAIAEAATNNEASTPPCAAFEAYIGTDHIPRWNDTRDSEAEVIEALRACAVIEAAKEHQDAPAGVTP